jgi:hypothetical protein
MHPGDAVSILDRLQRLFGGPARPAAGRLDAVRESMTFAGRARLITHVFDTLGEEGSSEFSFDPRPPGFGPLLVFESAPRGERTWWTYWTAGLSLCPAMDGHPPTELLACAEARSPGLVELLHQLAFREDPSRFFRPGDIVTFDADPPDLGIPLGRHYGLLAAPEDAAFTAFPDLDARPEDLRYVIARPGEDRTRVQFLRVVALADADPARWEAVRGTVDATRAWHLFGKETVGEVAE